MNRIQLASHLFLLTLLMIFLSQAVSGTPTETSIVPYLTPVAEHPELTMIIVSLGGTFSKDDRVAGQPQDTNARDLASEADRRIQRELLEKVLHQTIQEMRERGDLTSHKLKELVDAWLKASYPPNLDMISSGWGRHESELRTSLSAMQRFFLLTGLQIAASHEIPVDFENCFQLVGVITGNFDAAFVNHPRSSRWWARESLSPLERRRHWPALDVIFTSPDYYVPHLKRVMLDADSPVLLRSRALGLMMMLSHSWLLDDLPVLLERADTTTVNAVLVEAMETMTRLRDAWGGLSVDDPILSNREACIPALRSLALDVDLPESLRYWCAGYLIQVDRGWFSPELYLSLPRERRADFERLVQHGFLTIKDDRELSETEREVLRRWYVSLFRVLRDVSQVN